jgi:hypothetical protein
VVVLPVIPKDGHHKLHHPWTGPYRVGSKLSDLNYKIVLLHKESLKPLVVHFNSLKHCIPGTRFASSVPSHTTGQSVTPSIGDLATLCDSPDQDYNNDSDSDDGQDLDNGQDSEDFENRQD